MASTGTVLSYPIPAYQNLPIHADFYQPSRFVITDITRGNTTTITTSVAHNYVIGQNIRLIIPVDYGSFQLNETQGYVISIPSTTQVIVMIDSTNVDAFITNPYVSTITNSTQADPVVLTTNNVFLTGAYIRITDVGGMTELNENTYQILAANPISLTINADGAVFSAYTGGGTATLTNHQNTQPQILAIGDCNGGQINSSGRSQNITYVEGSFINVSP
jgi:hypothetical protein